MTGLKGTGAGFLELLRGVIGNRGIEMLDGNRDIAKIAAGRVAPVVSSFFELLCDLRAENAIELSQTTWSENGDEVTEGSEETVIHRTEDSGALLNGFSVAEIENIFQDVAKRKNGRRFTNLVAKALEVTEGRLIRFCDKHGIKRYHRGGNKR